MFAWVGRGVEPAWLFAAIDLSPDNLVLGLGWYAVFLVAITCHEAAHAWAAYLLGDTTAFDGGQVTLNPLPHIEREPIGTIVVPIITFFLNGLMLGWATAPYDPHWEARYPRRALIMALAGPAANLVLAILSGAILRVGLELGWQGDLQWWDLFRGMFGEGMGDTAGQRVILLFTIMFTLNVMLFLFNLIPLPPLDGSAIWPLLLHDRALVWFLEYRHQPGIILMGIMVASSLFGRIFWRVMNPILQFVTWGL